METIIVFTLGMLASFQLLEFIVWLQLRRIQKQLEKIEALEIINAAHDRSGR